MARHFGDKLRHLRRQCGMTQTELAQQLQLSSHSHINNLEAGRRAPSLNLVVRAAMIFGVTTDYLVRDTLPLAHAAGHRTETMVLPVEAPTRFGLKLRHLRTQRHLTQVQLAAALQLRTQAHLSLLERGHSEPSIAFTIQLADFFGVTTDYLLRDEIPIAMHGD